MREERAPIAKSRNDGRRIQPVEARIGTDFEIKNPQKQVSPRNAYSADRRCDLERLGGCLMLLCVNTAEGLNCCLLAG